MPNDDMLKRATKLLGAAAYNPAQKVWRCKKCGEQSSILYRAGARCPTCERPMVDKMYSPQRPGPELRAALEQRLREKGVSRIDIGWPRNRTDTIVLVHLGSIVFSGRGPNEETARLDAAVQATEYLKREGKWNE